MNNSSPLIDKARLFQENLLEKHLLEGLYISIVPADPGQRLEHTVDEPGNVIHAGVWTGRYLAGVGYQYAVTQDPGVRDHGGTILRGLRTLQEVTGKPGLLARGFVRGHGPVEGWERDGRDSAEWHQGQGQYADYRWYGDVSVDNFNAVLYGYAVYYDLAADETQKRFIARDVDRLMTHLLDHHCRIVDVDNEVTVWGHVGVDPDPSRDDYYREVYRPILARFDLQDAPWSPPLHASLMLLPDLLIASHITGKRRYQELYRRVIERFRDNPDPFRDTRPYSPERIARVNHSSEGQEYEALYNLIRYEHDPAMLAIYRHWVEDLWQLNWMEGNSLFTFMILALLPEYGNPEYGIRSSRKRVTGVAHGEEALKLSVETLKRFPLDRVFRPVMNSLDPEIQVSPHPDRAIQPQSVHPIPIDRRPLDNEYEWKASPYRLDGWLRPTVTAVQHSCDDPLVWWFCDSTGSLYGTRDGGTSWTGMTPGMMGAAIQNILASRTRTFVLHALTDHGILVTRDGGLSWRPSLSGPTPPFPARDYSAWQGEDRLAFRITEKGELLRRVDGGETAAPCMKGWRIPLARTVFQVPGGWIASGPGGCYRTIEGKKWQELKLWPEEETGAADFLHAYWMGRYYGLVPAPRAHRLQRGQKRFGPL